MTDELELWPSKTSRKHSSKGDVNDYLKQARSESSMLGRCIMFNIPDLCTRYTRGAVPENEVERGELVYKAKTSALSRMQ